MALSVKFPRCIVCLEQPPGDPEHVIPNSIGGRLKAPILCNDCNHGFGSELVSKLKTDPAIRSALEALKAELPSLYWRSQDKAGFFGTAPDGSKILVSGRKSRMKVLPSRGQKGSIIRDTRDIAKMLRTILKKRGATDQQIAATQEIFSQLEEDIPLRLPTGHTFIKRHGPPVRPDLGTEFASDRLWSLIAYEFLALVIGKHIYRDSFHPARQYVRFGTATDAIVVEHLSGGSQYGPLHALILEPLESGIRVNIRLFRWLVYQVTFQGIQLVGPDPVYFEDLKNQESQIALTMSDARRGNWLTFRSAA